MALRFDSGTLGKAERTPQGGLRVPARLTRVGVLEYRQPDGSIRRELRPPEEVFAADSLASLRGAPITDRHPGVVTARNYRALARGHVGDDVRQDGTYVEASAIVQDAGLVERVDSGAYRDVSAAYHMELDETPGVWRGQPYDAVQRSIRYNAAGLGPKGWGRAGTDVSLRLDGGGDEIPPGDESTTTPPEGELEKTMADKIIERIDGVEYEVGTDAHRSAVTRREQTEAERAKERSQLQARADAADAKVTTLEGQVKALEADIPKRAAERAALLVAAERAGVEVRTDAADADIRVAVLGKLAPGLRLDGKDEAYVAAMFDIQVEQAREAGVRRLGNAIVAPRSDAADAPASKADEARSTYLKRQAEAYKGPKSS